jgi:multimeric flavodoxin WrbA
MKIIGIVGSPRGLNGNTGRLLREVLAAAEGRGASYEMIALKGDTVLPCKACHTCHKKGFCPQKDDFNSIKEKILESDAVALASPNYIFTVSAQMKAFMDRCADMIHCMALEGKYGVSVVTSGGGDEPPIADFMNHFMLTMGITPVGSVWATMSNIRGAEFPDEIREQAKALGEKLVDWWQNKTSAPEIDKAKSEFADRMRNLMRYRKDEWPFEHEYWRKNRGLE